MTIKYYLDFEIDDKNDPVHTLHTISTGSRNLRKDIEKWFDKMTHDYNDNEPVFTWFRQLFIDVLRWYTEKQDIYQEYEDKDLVAKIVKMQVRFKDKKVYDITQFMKA